MSSLYIIAINKGMSKYKLRGIRIAEAKRMPLTEFIERANTIHNSRYDYSKTEYINAHTHIKIQCPEHGEFLQSPMQHLRGAGCSVCGNSKKGISKKKSSYIKFIEYVKVFHDNKYTYVDETFVGITKPMKIICPIHGEFLQSPDVHKRAGCQRCGSGPVSESSQKWLDSLNISIENREKWLTINGRRIKVDAFDPNTNTVYEYWGNYWHGNPKIYKPENINSHNKKSFGELYQLTLDRISLIKSQGYNIVDIWELDYINNDR